MFFLDASWKASRKVSGAKMEPKPSKITPKMDPKDAKRTRQKSADFVKEKSLKKHLPRPIFHDFDSIFGSPGDPRSTKNQKKQAKKRAKFQKAKQTPKIFKKGSGVQSPAPCADRWGGYGGVEKTSKIGQSMQKDNDDKNDSKR